MLNADYVKFDLVKVISLLRIGYTKVSADPHADEAIIMKASCQLLETLLENVKAQTSNSKCNAKKISKG